MLEVVVKMKYSGEPLKRTNVELRLDTEPGRAIEGTTDRTGVARFDIRPSSGKIIVAGIPRYHGRLDGNVTLELHSIMDSGSVHESGAPGGSKGGSTAYAGMQTRTLRLNNREIITDSEGYLVNLDDWSDEFVRAEAEYENLPLTDEHWEVIWFLRDYYEENHLQAHVRDIIKRFKNSWGPDKGSSRYLHTLFPRGGPQKQGNRLAGLLRVKGEH
jgi:tRNA 2-thiouridine synthesizing protein E